MKSHWILICLLMFSMTSFSQELGNSLTLGLEAYRPWTVSPTGVANLPVSLRFSQNLVPNWRVAITLGWETYEETGIDEIDFLQHFENGMGDWMTRSLTETTSTIDQVVSLSAGPRYMIPGGPEQLRMIIGVDVLSAYFPERTVLIDTRQRQTNELGEVLTFFESRATGSGYEGYGFGVQGSLGLELIVVDGLIVGMEFGPGTFARYRQVGHAFIREGTRQLDPMAATPETFEDEFFQGMGQESQSNVRFRGMLYVGWEF